MFNLTACHRERDHLRRNLNLEEIVSCIVFVLYKNKEIDISLSNVKRQDDDWATEVNGRLGFINELRAEDAIYHRSCNANFRTLKGKPKALTTSCYQTRGRPSGSDQDAAFIEVIKYLQKNDDEQITVSDWLIWWPNYVLTQQLHIWMFGWKKVSRPLWRWWKTRCSDIRNHRKENTSWVLWNQRFIFKWYRKAETMNYRNGS